MSEGSVVGIPKEVSEEVLEELKQAGRDAVAEALTRLAEAAEDGRVSPEEAGRVVGAVLEEILDGAVALVDALLPLPEPYESLSDLGLGQVRDLLVRESGPLEDLVRIVVDVLDGPEVEDIEAKIARHAYRYRVQGKQASKRKMAKHAMRMLRLFPGRAVELGIEGELGRRDTVVVGAEVRLVAGSDVPVLVPPR